jgi:hypothetical protein
MLEVLPPASDFLLELSYCNRVIVTSLQKTKSYLNKIEDELKRNCKQRYGFCEGTKKC